MSQTSFRTIFVFPFILLRLQNGRFSIIFPSRFLNIKFYMVRDVAPILKIEVRTVHFCQLSTDAYWKITGGCPFYFKLGSAPWCGVVTF